MICDDAHDWQEIERRSRPIRSAPAIADDPPVQGRIRTLQDIRAPDGPLPLVAVIGHVREIYPAAAAEEIDSMVSGREFRAPPGQDAAAWITPQLAEIKSAMLAQMHAAARRLGHRLIAETAIWTMTCARDAIHLTAAVGTLRDCANGQTDPNA